MTDESQTQIEDNKKKSNSRLNQSDIPSVKFSEALRIPIALRENYALKPATPLDVGVAIGIAPTSGGFRTLTGAAIAFGLTNGGYNASEIALTELGKRIVAPTTEGEDEIAKLEAFEKPRVIREFVVKYNGGKLPASKQIGQNVLHNMGVPYEATERAYDLLLTGLRELGYTREMNGSLFVQRPQKGQVLPKSTGYEETEEQSDMGFSDQATPAIEPPKTTPIKPSAIFLGHGKNKKPLDQLIKILDEYKIPHKEAVAEANAGRPIPTKVADTMRECGAAILVFTADEKFKDEADNEIWRPSENVVYELGAASVLYDNKIVIFKEEGVTLASNFSGIGYIGFEKDKLNDKGIELFRELVNFKLVNITVGS